MSPRELLVSEVFGPTVQGEGPLLGCPTVFVRLGGCSYRCTWCDSLHAVLPEHRGEWERLSAEQVVARVKATAPAPMVVTLSGGDPAQQDCRELVRLGHQAGYTWAIETQGAMAPTWLEEVDWVVMSPKPPSSHQVTRWDRLRRAMETADPWGHRGQRALKVPVFDEGDLDWVEAHFCNGHGHRSAWGKDWPVYVSVGNPHPPTDPEIPDLDRWGPENDGYLPHLLLERYEWLAGEVLRRRLPVIVTPQMHVLVWGNQRGR